MRSIVASAGRHRSRSPVPLCGVFALAITLLLTGSALGQLPHTRLYVVSPYSAKAGTTFDLNVVAGDDLDELNACVFNHPWITAVPKFQGPPGSQTQVSNTFVVSVAPDVPPGLYEIRVKGLYGLSNPRAFVVGSRDELREAEPNNAAEQATPVEINKAVTGTVNPATDIDWFRFAAKKGQRVIASCQAVGIDSRLEGRLEIYAADGRRLAAARNDIHDDPVTDISVPADGNYFVKLTDYLYRGGNDYFYRLTLSAGPHIDFVIPSSAVPGSRGNVTLYGRNLPGGQPGGVSIDGCPLDKLTVEIAAPESMSTSSTAGAKQRRSFEARSRGFAYTLNSPNGPSNPVIIQFATAPVVGEQEPNNDAAHAQKISVPAELSGQFQERGDSDVVDFEAKANEVYFVEVFGQRDGSNVDAFFSIDKVVRDAQGKETLTRIAAADDNSGNPLANIFDTATDDPFYEFRVPADGVYRVTVRDRYFESRGSPSFVYRLSIRRPAPGFDLLALPFLPAANGARQNATWGMGLRKGDHQALDVIAFRRDGFASEIQLHVDGLPVGVSCPDQTIRAGESSARLIFSAGETAPEWTGPIRVIGTARSEDPAAAKAVADAGAAVKSATEQHAKLQQAAQQAAAALAACQ